MKVRNKPKYRLRFSISKGLLGTLLNGFKINYLIKKMIKTKFR